MLLCVSAPLVANFVAKTKGGEEQGWQQPRPRSRQLLLFEIILTWTSFFVRFSVVVSCWIFHIFFSKNRSDHNGEFPSSVSPFFHRKQ